MPLVEGVVPWCRESTNMHICDRLCGGKEQLMDGWEDKREGGKRLPFKNSTI
jgi:hypothetical protein